MFICLIIREYWRWINVVLVGSMGGKLFCGVIFYVFKIDVYLWVWEVNISGVEFMFNMF